MKSHKYKYFINCLIIVDDLLFQCQFLLRTVCGRRSSETSHIPGTHISGLRQSIAQEKFWRPECGKETLQGVYTDILLKVSTWTEHVTGWKNTAASSW